MNNDDSVGHMAHNSYYYQVEFDWSIQTLDLLQI